MERDSQRRNALLRYAELMIEKINEVESSEWKKPWFTNSFSGNVTMSETSSICDYAQAKDNAKLKDACYVHGYVKLSGDCDISGCANLAGNVQIRKKGKISGNAVLTGNICVTENAKINGDVILSGDTIVKGNSHISTQIEANKIIKPCSLNEISKENSL